MCFLTKGSNVFKIPCCSTSVFLSMEEKAPCQYSTQRNGDIRASSCLLFPFATSLLYSLFHFCSKSLIMLQIIPPPLRAIAHFSVKTFPQCFVLINQTMISLPASLQIHVVHTSNMFSHSFIPHMLHGHTVSDTVICTKYVNIQGMLHTTDMPPGLMDRIFGQD